jgi:hypothetical protein
MRESRTYGSVRGALSNGRPYRDQRDAGINANENPRMSLRSSGLRLLVHLSVQTKGLRSASPAIANKRAL